jgi:hypothetical protein
MPEPCTSAFSTRHAILVHRNICTDQKRFLSLVEPFRDDLVVTAECIFTWYWIALLLKGGLLPQSYACPAAMRATRDLLRRRLHLARQRAHLIAHIQNTVHQYNLPALGVRLGKSTERGGVAECFPDPVVRRMLHLDLDLIRAQNGHLWFVIAGCLHHLPLCREEEACRHHPGFD